MSGSAATVGTFDGFHLGHRHMVDTLCHMAGERGLEPMLVTFTEHPLATLRPEAVPPLLMNRGPESGEWPPIRIVRLDFDTRMAALTSRQFLQLLRERFNVRMLVTGFNNRLGCDGPADISRYTAEGRAEDVEVCAATPLTLPDGTVPSSSAIRRALLAGAPEKASEMLGRPYSLEGESVPGRQNGRRLGFPTLNLLPGQRRLVPAAGVYAGFIDTPAADNLQAVINIGNNPTVADHGGLTIEGHAIGASLPYTYGEKIRFRFLSYLRPDRKFESLDELRAAIAADIEAATRLSSPCGGPCPTRTK